MRSGLREVPKTGVVLGRVGGGERIAPIQWKLSIKLVDNHDFPGIMVIAFR